MINWMQHFLNKLKFHLYCRLEQLFLDEYCSLYACSFLEEAQNLPNVELVQTPVFSALFSKSPFDRIICSVVIAQRVIVFVPVSEK